MFVDGVPFLATILQIIKFITAKHTPLQTTLQIKQSLSCVIHMYARAGFVVQTILVDGQFEPLKNHLLNVVISTTAASEHGNVEWCLWVIKEIGRAITSGLPYQRLPRQIHIGLVNFVVLWLNAFLTQNGVSSRLSPREIITGQQLDYSKHCKAEFGSYCKVWWFHTIKHFISPYATRHMSWADW